jgi:ABC-type sugar transport system permease subunit
VVRFLIGLPTVLLALALLAVGWLLVTSFRPAPSLELLQLTGPFMLRSAIFALLTAAGQVTLGLLAALSVLWVARARWSQLALITIFLLPYAVPASEIALAFRFAAGPQSVWANIMQFWFGVSPEYWLYRHAFEASILASIWQFFPFSFLLSYLALQTTPRAMLRAAQLDGAPFLHMTGLIVLARIWPVLTAIFALRLMFMLVKFDTPFIFTETIDTPYDAATVELWRAVKGSTSPELNIIAWSLQLAALALAWLYLRARGNALG